MLVHVGQRRRHSSSRPRPRPREVGQVSNVSGRWISDDRTIAAYLALRNLPDGRWSSAAGSHHRSGVLRLGTDRVRHVSQWQFSGVRAMVHLVGGRSAMRLGDEDGTQPEGESIEGRADARPGSGVNVRTVIGWRRVRRRIGWWPGCRTCSPYASCSSATGTVPGSCRCPYHRGGVDRTRRRSLEGADRHRRHRHPPGRLHAIPVGVTACAAPSDRDAPCP